MATQTFYCWLTLQTTYQADLVLAGMVKRGLRVKALGDNGRAITAGYVSCLLTLEVNTNRKFGKDQTGCAWMIVQVCEILREANFPHYYSLVVFDLTAGGQASWQGSNIPERSEEESVMEREEPPPSQEAAPNRLDEVLED